MIQRWLNDGEPDENGDYIAIIENTKGGRISTFKGKTHKEVADQLLNSQVNANLEIIKLRKPDAARPPMRVQPKELSPADRLRLSAEITDPEKVVEAVEEIVTARQGISPDRLGAEFGRMNDEERERYMGEEAFAFTRANPDYYPVPQNRDAIFEILKFNDWPITRNNLQIAFETLKEQGFNFVPWPEQTEEETQPTKPNGNGNGQATVTYITPNPRPRSVATGLRNADVSGQAPPPPKKPKYTRADIERMSRAEYTEKLRDPEFRRQVDAMGA